MGIITFMPGLTSAPLLASRRLQRTPDLVVRELAWSSSGNFELKALRFRDLHWGCRVQDLETQNWGAGVGCRVQALPGSLREGLLRRWGLGLRSFGFGPSRSHIFPKGASDWDRDERMQDPWV